MSSPLPILRQVVLGAPEIEATAAQLCAAFGLARGFCDPILETIGMADETIRVGHEAHLEVVAPLRETVPLASWITKGGGGGGYALSIQVSGLQNYLNRAQAVGVRVVNDMQVYGHRIVQLHPGAMGLLVELDEIDNPDQWFWDDIPRVAPPAPKAHDVRGVTLSNPDPAAQSALWSAIFATPIVDSTLSLGSRAVRFAAGNRKMLSSVMLAGDPAVGPIEIGGVRFASTE